MSHLVHPALVHFAVAFIVAGGLLEAGGLLARHAGATRFGGRLVVAGAIVLVPTIVSGYVAANTVDFTPAALRVLDDHERNGVILILACLGLLFWKGWLRGEVSGRARLPYVVALLATVGLAVWSALLGGRLVYGHGVGVFGP